MRFTLSLTFVCALLTGCGAGVNHAPAPEPQHATPVPAPEIQPAQLPIWPTSRKESPPLSPPTHATRRQETRRYPTGRVLAEYELIVAPDGQQWMHGSYAMYWGNGQILEEGDYWMGERVGPWKRYLSNGSPVSPAKVPMHSD